MPPTLLGPDGRPLERPVQKMGRNYLDAVHQWSKVLSNPEDVDLGTYERMVDTDETIGAGLDFLTLSVCAKLGEYSHPDERFQTFIRENFEGMRDTLAMAVSEILTAMWAGFSVTEIVLRSEGSRWMLDQLATLNPQTVAFGLDLEEGSPTYGDIHHIWQWRWTQWEVDLNPGQCLHYAHRSRFGNPYGKSRLKRAYAPWYIKTNLLPSWGRALDRYGSPLTVGKTPNMHQQLMSPYGGLDEQTRGEHMLARLQELIAGACMVLEEGESVEFEGLGQALGDSHEKAQNHLNKMELRALGLPSLIFDNTDVGSYSLGEKHYDVFIQNLEFLLLEVSEVLLEQLVRRLLWWNFGWTGELGEFAQPSLQPEDQAALVQGFVQLTSAGYMSPELQADLNHVREKVGLEPVEAMPYTAPAAPALPAPAEEPEGPETPPEETERPVEMRLRLLRDVRRNGRAVEA